MTDQKHAASDLMRIPVLLPRGRDAALVSRILEKEGNEAVVCESLHEMLDYIRTGCGPFVVGDEALSENALYRLKHVLDSQPEWSDLPGIVLIGQSARRPAFERMLHHREISLVRRPINKAMFVTIVRTAVEARQRQYQVRDLLADLLHTNEKLRSRTELLQKLALELTRAEDRERKRIAQVLHDDLQQILASARLQTEILFDHVKDEPARKVQMVYDIISEAMSAARSLSHELNPAFIHRENFCEVLKKLANRMAENFGFQVQTRIQIDNNRIGDDTKIFVYRGLQELLFNCAKHAGAARVSIEVAEQGPFCILSITDDGVGFDSEQLKIHGGEKGGFGLFSIQERAEALGGFMKVQSTPNQGSRFVVQLPLEPAGVSGKRADDAATQSVGKDAGEGRQDNGSGKSDAITVMIVDDHAVMRQGLAALLRNQPEITVVAEASDGQQAVDFALQYRPAVVLMDYSMPLLNGAEATRKIKQEVPEIAVIGLSMYGDQGTRKEMMDAGAQSFLQKDVQANDLIEAIKRCAN